MAYSPLGLNGEAVSGLDFRVCALPSAFCLLPSAYWRPASRWAPLHDRCPARLLLWALASRFSFGIESPPNPSISMEDANVRRSPIGESVAGATRAPPAQSSRMDVTCRPYVRAVNCRYCATDFDVQNPGCAQGYLIVGTINISWLAVKRLIPAGCHEYAQPDLWRERPRCCCQSTRPGWPCHKT